MRITRYLWLVIGISVVLVAAGCTTGVGGSAIKVAPSGLEPQVSASEDAKPWIGIRIKSLTPHFARNLSLSPETGGIVIVGISQSSPGAEAGLERRDVIRAVDGEPLASAKELVESVKSRDPGDVVTLTLLREGEELDIAVELDQAPEFQGKGIKRGLGLNPERIHRLRTPSRLGLVVVPITRQVAEKLNIGPAIEGVVVLHALPRSPAKESGLKRGDVIQSINGESVTSAGNLRAQVLETGPGGTVILGVFDGRETSTVEIEVRGIGQPFRGLHRYRGLRQHRDLHRYIAPSRQLEASLFALFEV